MNEKNNELYNFPTYADDEVKLSRYLFDELSAVEARLETDDAYAAQLDELRETLGALDELKESGFPEGASLGLRDDQMEMLRKLKAGVPLEDDTLEDGESGVVEIIPVRRWNSGKVLALAACFVVGLALVVTVPKDALFQSAYNTSEQVGDRATAVQTESVSPSMVVSDSDEADVTASSYIPLPPVPEDLGAEIALPEAVASEDVATVIRKTDTEATEEKRQLRSMQAGSIATTPDEAEVLSTPEVVAASQQAGLRQTSAEQSVVESSDQRERLAKAEKQAVAKESRDQGQVEEQPTMSRLGAFRQPVDESPASESTARVAESLGTVEASQPLDSTGLAGNEVAQKTVSETAPEVGNIPIIAVTDAENNDGRITNNLYVFTDAFTFDGVDSDGDAVSDRVIAMNTNTPPLDDSRIAMEAGPNVAVTEKADGSKIIRMRRGEAGASPSMSTRNQDTRYGRGQHADQAAQNYALERIRSDDYEFSDGDLNVAFGRNVEEFEGFERPTKQPSLEKQMYESPANEMGEPFVPPAGDTNLKYNEIFGDKHPALRDSTGSIGSIEAGAEPTIGTKSSGDIVKSGPRQAPRAPAALAAPAFKSAGSAAASPVPASPASTARARVGYALNRDSLASQNSSRQVPKAAAPAPLSRAPESLGKAPAFDSRKPKLATKGKRIARAESTATKPLGSVADGQAVAGARIQPAEQESGMMMESVEEVYFDESLALISPKSQKFDMMYFVDPGVYPTKDATAEPQSTFGLDVDTGSFQLAREYLGRGVLPPREAIRPEEFVNAVPANWVQLAEEQAETLKLHLDGAASRRDPAKFLIRVGVQGKTIELDDRPTARLTFVIDVSGSMDRENRLELVKRSLEYLLDNLAEGDQVSIVTYNKNPQLVLPPTGIENADTIRRAIRSLKPGGSTNLAGGLTLGYQQARESFKPGGINRIILCSDGVANVGETKSGAILQQIGRNVRGGIQLTSVGFGMGNYNDALLEQLANRGDGQYAYLNQFDEAKRFFGEQLGGGLITIAYDAKIQVTFNPQVVATYRLLGYENRALANQDFRNDAVDAGEIGSGHKVSALYEITLQPTYQRDPNAAITQTDADAREVSLLTAALRWQEPIDTPPLDLKPGERMPINLPQREAFEIDADLQLDKVPSHFQAAPVDFQVQAILAEFAEILRGSLAGDEQTLQTLAIKIEQLRLVNPSADETRLQLLQMLQQARQLWSQRARN
jgi:Ca-activated chloride channel family protein